jgi:3-hydroxyisobutyrate dehydrogenase-like beta-hydroxyacid dehydrogenase
MKVGWIGLGQIGMPMALRVLGAGHDLIAHSRSKDHPELVGVGGRITRAIAETVADREVVCVNVFDDAQLRDVLQGDDGALRAMPAGSLLIIHTTGSPRLTRELAREAAARGIELVDATFSGTAENTADGRLTIMIGGTDSAHERARGIVSTSASHIVHAGPVGAGQVLKLINNALFAAQVQLGVVALRTAEAAGIAGPLAAETIARCSGGSYAVEMLGRNYPIDDFLAAVAHYLDKDLAVARQAAADAGLNIDALLRAASPPA